MTASISPGQLAAAVGEAGELLGLRSDPDQISGPVLAAVREPLEDFHRQLNWPSALNDSGPPVELSLKLDRPGSTALRCVVDLTDHHHGPAGNWQRYLDHSAAVTGCRAPAQLDAVWELCRRHLDGVPPGFPSRLVHGLGFAGPDRVRGSLYFRTGWMSPDRLAERVPEHAALVEEVRARFGCPLPDAVEVMGYDFTAGERQRAKAYTWLPVRPGISFAALAGTNPDLAAARELFDRYAYGVPAAAREHAVFLQSSRMQLRQRLFFFAAAWGWTTSSGLKDLLGVLTTDHGVDLEPLLRFRQVLTGHGLSLRLSMVAVGGPPDQASVTFYFLPAAVPLHPRSSGPALGDVGTDQLAGQGVAFLLAQRGPDGEWTDQDTTALVTAILAEDPARPADLAPTADWLTQRLGSGLARPQPDSAADPAVSALTVLALARLGRPLPTGWRALLTHHREPAGQSGGDAELTATVLLALLEAAPSPEQPEAAAIEDAVTNLLRLQHPDGGWAGPLGSTDLAATGRALGALAALAASRPDPGRAGEIRRALDHGLAQVGRTLVSGDPFQLGLWLQAWLVGGGSLRNATVARIVESLVRQQRPDGRWPGAPTHSSRAGGPSIDASSVRTTATVVQALHTLSAINQP